MMTNGTLLFAFFSLYWMRSFPVNTTCFVKTMVNARIVVTPLIQMTFQFPKPFFGGLFVGAYIYIKGISKRRTNRIFHNIIVLTFSLLLQIFEYNVYKCIYI